MNLLDILERLVLARSDLMDEPEEPIGVTRDPAQARRIVELGDRWRTELAALDAYLKTHPFPIIIGTAIRQPTPCKRCGEWDHDELHCNKTD